MVLGWLAHPRALPFLILHRLSETCSPEVLINMDQSIRNHVPFQLCKLRLKTFRCYLKIRAEIFRILFCWLYEEDLSDHSLILFFLISLKAGPRNRIELIHWWKPYQNHGNCEQFSEVLDVIWGHRREDQQVRGVDIEGVINPCKRWQLLTLCVTEDSQETTYLSQPLCDMKLQ